MDQLIIFPDELCLIAVNYFIHPIGIRAQTLLPITAPITWFIELSGRTPCPDGMRKLRTDEMLDK